MRRKDLTQQRGYDNIKYMRKITLWKTPDDSYAVDCVCNFSDRSFIIDGDKNKVICSECNYEEPLSEFNQRHIPTSDVFKKARSVSQ